MYVNEAGIMASDTWYTLPDRFPTIRIDAFVIMPNHIHGVIMITDDAAMKNRNVVGAGLVPALDIVSVDERATTRVAPTLGEVIGAYKSMVTVQYTRAVHTHGWPPFRKHLWQRNYYEHVVRNEESLNRIRQYILDNPQYWYKDRYNPNVRKGNE
jgi:REP element-mobilizing transposase RayT